MRVSAANDRSACEAAKALDRCARDPANRQAAESARRTAPGFAESGDGAFTLDGGVSGFAESGDGTLSLDGGIRGGLHLLGDSRRTDSSDKYEYGASDGRTTTRHGVNTPREWT
jgi:hypothetical protein